MSHNTTYGKRISDLSTLCIVAQKHGEIVSGPNLEVRLFGSHVVKNAVAEIKLPGWKYPIAVTADGDIIYDHWGSQSGTMDKLHLLVQDYNIAATENVIPYDEVTNVSMETLPNGDKKMVLEYS